VNHEGWIGTMGQVLHYLAVVKADRDKEGQFVITGPMNSEPVTFMGLGGPDAECIIPGDVDYLVGGRACNLAAGLRSTSYGFGVKVFMAMAAIWVFVA
jgi:hypothetical protein